MLLNNQWVTAEIKEEIKNRQGEQVHRREHKRGERERRGRGRGGRGEREREEGGGGRGERGGRGGTGDERGGARGRGLPGVSVPALPNICQLYDKPPFSPT